MAESTRSELQVAASEPAYPQRRADGWPLCPGCGDDELWSAAVPATVDTIVSCLGCGWKPGYYRITAAGRSTSEADDG